MVETRPEVTMADVDKFIGGINRRFKAFGDSACNLTRREQIKRTQEMIKDFAAQLNEDGTSPDEIISVLSKKFLRRHKQQERADQRLKEF